MRGTLTLLFFLVLSGSAQSGERLMAVTLDDLPMNAGPTVPEERFPAMNRRLIRTLLQFQVPAIGFVNESKLFKDHLRRPDRVALLSAWLDAGLALGNHGYAHQDFHRVGTEAFIEDARKGETVTRELLSSRGGALVWFRHPFLHTGTDADARARFEADLEDRGMRAAPVTIDNSEWIYARAYENALTGDDSRAPDRVAESYLDYMEKMIGHYEDQSRTLFGEEPPQILLLHANLLNADHMGALLQRVVDRGYRFVPLEEATRHPAYQSEDRYFGPGGITWLHRWSLTRGVEREFYEGEPTCPVFIQELAGIQE